MRIGKLREVQEREGLGAYIITRSPNVLYYTGSTSGGILISTLGEEPLLLVSRMNLEMARAEAKGCEIATYERKTLLRHIAERVRRADPKISAWRPFSNSGRDWRASGWRRSPRSSGR